MDSVKIVDAAFAGDKESFMAAFNAALANKVSDALEVKKVEMASTLLSPGLENNEVQGTENQVDGSTDGGAAEPTEG